MLTDKDGKKPVATDKLEEGEVPKTPKEKKLQQSDPQLTELKGFVDAEEELEVKGTDNPF